MEAFEQVVNSLLDLLFRPTKRIAVCRNALCVFGAVCIGKAVIKTVWSLGRSFCGYFLAPWGISRINLTKYGSWAIVTGASEGIGRGYALELAKQGLNVVILSRSEAKLQLVADRIREQYNREVRIVSVDFTHGQSVYDTIEAAISDLDVGILVNNVALCLSEYPKPIMEVDEMHHRNVIEVNCQTIVQMCHLVLPKMVKKRRGVIVNISSMSSIQPCPLMAVYSATKKFIDYFSDGLRYEYRSQGIIVQTITPGEVSTASSGADPGIGIPTPEEYCRSAVATIGVQHNSNGYLSHAIQASIGAQVPVGIWMRLLYIKLLKKKEDILRKSAETA